MSENSKHDLWDAYMSHDTDELLRQCSLCQDGWGEFIDALSASPCPSYEIPVLWARRVARSVLQDRIEAAAVTDGIPQEELQDDYWIGFEGDTIELFYETEFYLILLPRLTRMGIV